MRVYRVRVYRVRVHSGLARIVCGKWGRLELPHSVLPS